MLIEELLLQGMELAEKGMAQKNDYDTRIAGRLYKLLCFWQMPGEPKTLLLRFALFSKKR